MPGFVLDQRGCATERGSYGRRGSIAKNGCGAIAAYNACLILDRPVSLEEAFRSLGKGALLGGRMGTNPFALRRYLRGRGIRLSACWRTRSARSHRAYISLCLFRRGFRLYGHYFALAPLRAGFLAYNDGQDGRVKLYETLSDVKRTHKALLLWVWGLD